MRMSIHRGVACVALTVSVLIVGCSNSTTSATAISPAPATASSTVSTSISSPVPTAASSPAPTTTGSAASATTNLIENGGFETPDVPVGSFTLFSPGQAFTGWKVVGTGGNVGIVSDKYLGDGITFNAQAGTQWMDLTGLSNTPTGIARSIATTPGTEYHLTFWVGNVYDPGGIFGTSSTVKVYVNGSMQLIATNSLQPPNHTQAWKEFALTIKATSSSTTISFINGDPSTDNSDGLDAVQLS
jgi:hypothetical protein